MKFALAVNMGLFLHNVASATPTVSTTDRNLLLCEGVNNQSYMCESGHCCGESQCCSYYYELWWFLPSYLLPDYEEVVNRPSTPPPPYSVLHSGPSSAGPSSQSHTEQQDGHCPAVQPTPVPPNADRLCNGSSPVEPQPPTLDLMPKADNKAPQTTQDSGVILLSDGISSERLSFEEKNDCKDPLLKDLSDDKDRLPNGRRRRFTGDSGIEVCVCGTRGSSGCSGVGGPEGKEFRELESLLGREGNDQEEAGDFCDSCVHRSSYNGEEEQVLGGSERRMAPGSSQTAHLPGSASLHPPVCLLLHTINEQEGPHYTTTIEPLG
ncbi:WW domain binding protein 1-like b isoform X4 [Corythoichthys intestinalis]|uniref:WW domain binding protein 1-like b isoform X4 n=1 Tax=Corythoichthys intestinalis TaxID=161448 RepID=UPI0025A60603|nr:WW domain binding protein 1-like b isoform X4 [Corythoichthys intestinalis]